MNTNIQIEYKAGVQIAQDKIVITIENTTYAALNVLNQAVFAKGLIWIGSFLWHRGDQKVIDGFFVNGSAYTVGRFAGVIRHLQSGYLYHYAFAMIAGLAALLAWVLYAYLPFVR